MTAGILRAHLLSRSAESDAGIRARIESLCEEALFAWHHAEMAVVCRLFSARAHLAAGEAERGARDLDAARKLAREMGHVWLELRAIREARDAGLSDEAPRAAELATVLRNLNADRHDLVDGALDNALG